jgi:hypothetical protein
MIKLKRAVWILLGFALFFLALGHFMSHPPPPLSDAEMALRFTKHRADLDQLVKMLDEDRAVGLVARDHVDLNGGSPWPRPEKAWGISKARWNEYKGIFKRAEIPRGVIRDRLSGETMIYAWTWGEPVPLAGKAFVHCGKPAKGEGYMLPPCVEGKEWGRRDDGVRHTRYKELDGRWYLFEERE